MIRNKIILFVLLAAILSSCKPAERDREDLEFLKASTQKIRLIQPDFPENWDLETQNLLERYFRTVSYWTVDAKAHRRNNIRIPKGTRCEDFLLTEREWEYLTMYCQKDELYFCPEEMKNYGFNVKFVFSIIKSCGIN